MVTVLLHAAAQFAHMVVAQPNCLLPEGELLVTLVGEQADIDMRLGEVHEMTVRS